MDTEPVADWIIPGAQLKTRAGLPVRIYATDVKGDYSIHGAIFMDGAWCIAAWAAGGRYFDSDTSSEHDLMKPARRWVAYVLLDAGGGLHLTSTLTETNWAITGSVRVEVVEGEFADGNEK